MKYKFNQDAKNHRVAEQVAAAGKQIEDSWERGVSPVNLEVDTDVYPLVRKILLSTVKEVGLARLNSKSYSLQLKSGKTKFRVVNVNYL